ncbi:MAG TPA: pyridoxal phosphate-dependent aminotransferase, partial [Thermoanaerobaculia bacterium]|nr:pyridoxal phosphate-dependent aminotransferase [Thermoanaerobaculia bacterium]
MGWPEHDPERTHWAPYMEWAQERPPARHDLAGSNLLPVEPDELEGATLALHGANTQGYPPLLEALAAHYGVERERIATASGASGANFVALAALLAPGDEVLCERPGYDPIPGAARLLGAPVRGFERRAEEGWRLDPDRIEAAVTPATRVLALTNPHNPTGALASGEELDALGRLAERRGLWVLVDEVYLDSATFPGVFAPPDRTPQLAELTVARRGAPFVATSSLTKSYGLSGLRCGWAVAPPALAAAIRRARGVVDAVAPFPTDVLAAVAFAQIERLAGRAAELLRANLEALVALVDARDALAWSPPQGGTVAFPRVVGLDDTGDLCRALHRESGVAVVPGALFGAPAHLRVSYGGLRREAFR